MAGRGGAEVNRGTVQWGWGGRISFLPITGDVKRVTRVTRTFDGGHIKVFWLGPFK